MSDVRQSLIVLQEPVAPDAVSPICKWCGEEIKYKDIATPRHRLRAYHRGDKYEIGSQNCRREHKHSFCWSGRDALRWQARDKTTGQYVLFCVDCGELVEKGQDRMARRMGGHRAKVHTPLKSWEADHQIPVIDGGPHTLENLRCRCTPCHKIKTTAEGRTRQSGDFLTV